MREPAFYPHRPSQVTHLETHISHIFLAGDLVYKIKKPVGFSFLDFSTLQKRRYFLHEELRLNRRLAPSVYLGVLPISCWSGGWRLGGYGHPAEYTLVMRRLPARRMLPFLLERDQATPEMMESVAEALAPFHAQAATGDKISSYGHPQALRKLWEENLADVEPFVGRFFDIDALETFRDFGARFMAKHGELLLRRVRDGRIREVHGDLHCEHICFAPEGIQIFDCVEFSLALRCCDVASEVAFLLMDLEFRGAGDLGRRFLKRYLELAGDHELSLLLPFYKCHRALVRGKVTALSPDGLSSHAARYFDYARRVTWEARKPSLIVLCGLTGSGKSTLARSLAQRLGFTLISSDATRKSLSKSLNRRQVPYGQDIYAPSMTERTYASMIDAADRLIQGGEGVILDATFHQRARRDRVYGLVAKHGAPMVWIQCVSSEEVTQERLKRRWKEGRDLSDGRWEIYLKQKAAFEPLEEVPREVCLSLDTEAPPETLVRSVERFIDTAVPW
jgi:aminoglycoside phosphotransferase family enzyme/predicted kinase